MFDGFLRFGGVEVINADRMDAYAKAGCVPEGVEVSVPNACLGLGEALGDAPYTMPAIDVAPWYEPEDPGTHWFGGVLPLEVTGLDGSTRAAGSAEKLGDGGVATMARRTTRTITVSALLVGRDAASVHAGLEWLTTVLHRTCSEDDPCAGVTLEAFTTCPAPLNDTEDLAAAMVAHVQDPAGRWYTSGGAWAGETSTFRVAESGSAGLEVFDGGSPTDAGDGTVLDGGDPNAASDPTAVLFGGDPDDPAAGTTDGGGVADAFTDLSDGGTPATAFDTTADGGGVRSYGVNGVLASPTVFGCLSEVEARWTLTPLAGSSRIRVGVVDRFGRILEQGPEETITGATTVTRRYLEPRWDEWRPAVWVDQPGAGAVLDVWHRPDVDPDACLTPYRRTFSNVSTLAGPTPVEVIETDDDSNSRLVRVEWTWVAGDPFRYGDPKTIVAGLPGTVNGPADVLAVGATPDYRGGVTAAATACARPTSSAVVCAADPTYPAFVAPPPAPTVADTAAPAPTDYLRSTLRIDSTLVPNAGVGAATFVLVNDATEKRGIRVRLWVNPATAFTDVPGCGFANEFTVNYLAAGATMTVDTVAGSVTVVCADGTTEDARSAVRGSYGGVLRFPTLACDRRHWVAVDTPSGQGALEWSLLLSPREG